MTIPSIAVGQLVTPTGYLNPVGDAVNHLNGLKLGNTTLENLATGKELRDPDYDSGWFSVTYNTTYAKAHGLSAKPRLVQILWDNSATPTEWRVVYSVRDTGSVVVGTRIVVDSTDITTITGNDATAGTIRVMGTSFATGYYRFLAWL